MTMEELQLMCELPNYSSFADASFYLPYSPATITKYVNNVEEELGIKIFIRSSKVRNLQLTEEGKLVHESFKRIYEDYGYLKKQVNLIKNQDNKRLRIGSQPRFGNIHEQKIIASFLLQYPSAQVSMHKDSADELLRGLISGKIDVAIITFNSKIPLHEYFGENRPRLKASFIVSEPNMYIGVSEKYFKNQKEVRLKDLENFTLAFPFPSSNDAQSTKAMESWREIARANEINLKYINIQGYDNTIFEMAAAQNFAITTTNIPSVNYPGVHFLKIADWTGGNNLYLVRLNGQEFEALSQFEEVTEKYSASQCEKEED